MLAADGFFSQYGLSNIGFRWLHILAGIAWIGLLYYFNFVQVPAFAEYGDEARARNIAIDKVARRALWWFRWAALSTFVTGILITIVADSYFSNDFGTKGAGLAISTGMLIGTIMFVNVWGVIWRNQKIVLANAANVIAGGEPNPDAAAAGRKAFMASRQNVVFSVTMLFFMVYKGHTPEIATEVLGGGKVGSYWVLALIIIAVLEINALGLMPWKTAPKKGLNIIYETVQNAIIASFVLWAIFLVMTEIFFRA
jgi:uncharacterized membrane protein